ncbi:MAG: FAD-dependent oxidoreductase [Paracoccaceae bacterium]|nr:FAD-dependent oxidoreductase [Paracoccaceae bacterium]
MAEKVVVVGAGQSGASLVTKLRNDGFTGAITLIGDESVPPYQRPPLSKKYLLGEMAEERLYLKPEAFYAEHEITLLTGAPAAAIDRAAREVVLGDDRIAYDALALTTGSRPRLLPAAIGGDLDGVYPVRTLADVDAMAPEVQPGRRVLIIGGGYIGLEAAAVCAMKGLQVTLVEMAPRILQRVAAPETSDFVRALHQGHGVEIREGVGLERLTGEGRIASAALSTGEELEVDFAIMGIGITPNAALAEAAGLEIDNGIAVDGHCRTSDPAIYAAGDCASFPYKGARIRLESVQNAIDQAEHVASVIMGGQDAYLPYPWFWSDQYDARLQIAGLNTGYDSVVVRPGHRPGGQSIWYFQGIALLAVDAVSDPKAYMQGKRWIEAGLSPDPNAVGNPETDLRGLC